MTIIVPLTEYIHVNESFIKFKLKENISFLLTNFCTYMHHNDDHNERQTQSFPPLYPTITFQYDYDKRNYNFYGGNHEQCMSIIPQIVTKNSIIRTLL